MGQIERPGTSEVSVVPRRRWSDRSADAEEAHGLSAAFEAIRRRKWLVLAAFVVTAIAGGAILTLPVTHEAICLVAVKKPSQMFVAVGQVGPSMSASVPLLEGQTYKDMVESLGFGAKVASSLAARDTHMMPSEVRRRLRAEFREPDLLRLRARAAEPAMAIRIANTGCETLAEVNQKELRGELEAAVHSTARLLDDAARDVKRAQDALADYTKRKQLVNVDFNSASSELFRSMELIAGNERERAKEEAALRSAEERLKELTVRRGTVAAMQAFPVEDPAVTTLRLQIQGVRSKLWEARKQFTDAHPIVRDLRANLDELEKELARELQDMRVKPKHPLSAEYELAIRQQVIDTNQEILGRKAQLAAWADLIDSQRRALGVVPGQRAEVEELKLRLAFAEDRYRTLSRTLDETRVSADSTKGTLSIVQLAAGTEPPTNRRILVVIGLLVLVPLGVGLLKDYTDTTIHSPMVLSRQVDLLCLATVPKARQLRSRRVLLNGDSKGPFEAFHILRTGLRFAAGDHPLQRIAIVGPRPREGRSTLLLHLARALAADGKRIVVIDTDFRSSRLPGMLGIRAKSGLVEVLMGEASLGGVLSRITAFDALLLPAKADGRSLPPNAELLFRSPRFEQLVTELGRQSDVLLFDTPPLTMYADALELLPHMDGVIFVAEAGSVTQETVRRGLDLVRASGARSLGVVLNKTRVGW